MKRFFTILVCLSITGGAFAKHPLQPVVVDGDNYEWRLVAVEPVNLDIGKVRSFQTNGFLYLSTETYEPRSTLMLGMQGSPNKVELDIKTNSGAVYLGSFGLRLPFFDGILGISSAARKNSIEARVPLEIFGSDIANKEFRIQVSTKVENFQSKSLQQDQKENPWTVGGISKLDAIIQQESEGELHIRLMEDQISPLSAIQHIAKWELAEAAEILNQIKDIEHLSLKPWALIALAEVVMHQGNLEQSKLLHSQAISYLDAKWSIVRIQESTRLKIRLKRDPTAIINQIGDLSTVNIDTRYRVGKLWALVGNFPEATKVFEAIVEDNPDTYHQRRSQWYLDNVVNGGRDGERLYSAYRLVANGRWAEAASIYAQAREEQSRFLQDLVSMLHRLDAYNPVFTEYLKTIK
ncbi:MAG: hypothetical protein OXR72_14595 [Gemmatimonadota bacterium]|nr:hypothetical protein [Gemmatimonadota bacterium]